MPEYHERDLRELLHSAFPDDAVPDRLLEATRVRVRRREARRRTLAGGAAAVVLLALLAAPAVVDLLTRQNLRFDPPLDQPDVVPPAPSASPTPTPTPSPSPSPVLPTASPRGSEAVAPAPAPARSDPAASQSATLDVYFSLGQPGEDGCPAVTPVDRRVRGPGFAAGALAELLQGPTEEESAMGYSSPFGPATDALPFTVRIENGTAFVDFGSVEGVELPDTACRAQAVLAPLDSTLLQFPTVERTRFSLRGSEEDFYTGWLGISPP